MNYKEIDISKSISEMIEKGKSGSIFIEGLKIAEDVEFKEINRDELLKKQRFKKGERVLVNRSDFLLNLKSHSATIIGTHAEEHGSQDIKSYGLDLDGFGKMWWFMENEIESNNI